MVSIFGQFLALMIMSFCWQLKIKKAKKKVWTFLFRVNFQYKHKGVLFNHQCPV